MDQPRLERECLEAFRQGDKRDAERLLPQVRQPDKVRMRGRVFETTTSVNCIDIDNTVQVDTQRGNKRRGPRKYIETLTASGVGVLHKVVKLFLRF